MFLSFRLSVTIWGALEGDIVVLLGENLTTFLPGLRVSGFELSEDVELSRFRDFLRSEFSRWGFEDFEELWWGDRERWRLELGML